MSSGGSHRDDVEERPRRARRLQRQRDNYDAWFTNEIAESVLIILRRGPRGVRGPVVSPARAIVHQPDSDRSPRYCAS